MIQISDIMWLGSIVLLLMYWWSALGIREIALASVKAYCLNADVQFLDDAIVLRGYWFKRDEAGNIRVWRSYLFEFATSGEHRYQGRIILLGRKVLNVQLEAYRI